MVPFAVACARCGQDLHGRSEPVCPKCGLQFDWAEAVPVERLTCAQCGYHLYGLTELRCPECGRPFTWEGALVEYHRRQHFLFEYRWRDRPVRALVTTWWRALWPSRFWTQVSLHDPPNVRVLVVMVVILLAAFFVAMPVSMGLSSWGMACARGRGWATTSFTYWMTRMATADEVYVWLGVVATWCTAGLGALALFRQSMRRYRVRFPHVVRVWACATPLLPVLFPMVFGGFVYVMNITRASWAAAWSQPVERVAFLLLAFVLLHAIWSISRGYRHYLKMRHATAVAVATQTIAVLTAMVPVAILSPGWFNQFVIGLLRALSGR